jgi:hypothetical protein
MKTGHILIVNLEDGFSALAVTKYTNIQMTFLRILLICMLTALVACQRNSSAQMTSKLSVPTPSSGELTVAANAPQNEDEKPINDSTIPLTTIGYFTNVKYTGEHAYGYSVNLWRQEDNILGLISAHSGLIGDPPAGLLEDVKFDPRTNRLSFRAKLTTGLVYSRQYKGVPSRDVFEFSGFLNKDKLSGVLEISNLLFPDDPPQRKRISLRRSAKMSKAMMPPENYIEWKKMVDGILKFRGPRW